MSLLGPKLTSGTIKRMSDVGGIVLQNYFELPSEEIFFKIAHRCGILIQETARSDSILARFRLIHCSRASFATQSPRFRISLHRTARRPNRLTRDEARRM